jgi:hypothetical protein
LTCWFKKNKQKNSLISVFHEGYIFAKVQALAGEVKFQVFLTIRTESARSAYVFDMYPGSFLDVVCGCEGFVGQLLDQLISPPEINKGTEN